MLCARIELGSSCEWPSVARTVQRYRPPGQGTRLDAAHTAPESQRQVLPPGFLHLTRKHVRTDSPPHVRTCQGAQVRARSELQHRWSRLLDRTARLQSASTTLRHTLTYEDPVGKTTRTNATHGSPTRVHSTRVLAATWWLAQLPLCVTWWRSWTIRLQRLPTHRTASEQPACCHDNHQRGLSCPCDVLAQSTVPNGISVRPLRCAQLSACRA